MGILSVQPSAKKFFDSAERDLLQAFSVLIGLVLEKEHIIQAFKHAEVLEVSEHLQRVFLQSVSHELETPLSAIQTGLDVLVRQVEGGRRAQEDTRRAASGCAPTGSGDQ